MSQSSKGAAGKCPVMHGGQTSADQSNVEWWPESLNLDISHQHDGTTSTMGEDFDNRDKVRALDFDSLWLVPAIPCDGNTVFC